MKSVTIQSLRLKNFKGVRDFTIEPDGQSINVFGKNASGKTTIQDAFFYLLFGKDSNDRADFQLKPVSDDGQEIHHLETEVEAVLDVDGKAVTLMKLYKEKWTKAKGTATKEFTGHTTEHFIDGVPVKKKDYDNRICELININAFKLVTSPFEFANLQWQARRNMLLEMCGDVSDQDVIQSDVELAPLSTILAGCSVDDHRLKVKSQQKKINEKLKEIPARIAENQEIVKDAPAPDQKEKDLLDKKLADEQENLRQNQSNEALSSARVELNEVNAAILKERAIADEQNRKNKKDLLATIDNLESEKRAEVNRLEGLKDSLAVDERRKDIMSESIDNVRKNWHKENGMQPTNDTTCPTCGQQLPPDQIEEATDKFNQAKAQCLKKIKKEGHQLKDGIATLEIAINEAQGRINDLEAKIHGIDSSINEKRNALSGIKSVTADTEELEQKKASLQSTIDGLLNGSGIRERDIVERISGYQGQIDEWKKQEAEYKAAEKARVRINELEAQEKALTAEYEDLEKELYLTDRFIVRKVEMLEDSINSRFKLTRFKLFETQVNGGLKECCEILYRGVPFDKGLNNAARLNVGIDIINTLSNYLQFQAPIFCDNAESVNVLAETPAQVIGLYVSEHDALTVEKTEIKKAS